MPQDVIHADLTHVHCSGAPCADESPK